MDTTTPAFSAAAPPLRGHCETCGYEGDLHGGQIPRHKQRRVRRDYRELRVKGVVYLAKEDCKGGNSDPWTPDGEL